MKRNLNTGKLVRYTTALLFIFTACTFQSYGQLKGIYSINNGISASNTNYTSFGAAVDDLLNGARTDGGTPNGKGVDSAVIFNVADGSYSESVNLSAVKGASAANTITFQSASGDSTKVTLRYPTQSGTAYALSLAGARYIHFNQITIARTGTANGYARVILIDNGASHNSITNCRIIGLVNGNTLVYSDSGPDTANNIQNNLLKYGSFGFAWASTGAVAGVINMIVNNSLDSISGYGAELENQNSITVSGNIITNIYGANGIGIYLNTDSVAYVNKNVINMPNGGWGIYITGLYSTGRHNSILSNNMVTLSGTTGVYDCIYLGNASYTNVLFNSLLATNNGATPFYVGSANGLQSINVENNIGYNSGGGLAVNWNSNTDYNIVDYNDWYTTGANLAGWGGTNYSNLTNWVLATSIDSHSVSVNPQFISTSDLDASAAGCYRAGTQDTIFVRNDIHGTTRNKLHPCIGADEFTLPAIDAGIAAIDSPMGSYCKTGAAHIAVTIADYGLDTLTGAQIGWSVNGVVQSAYTWTGSLSLGKTSVVSIGTYSFAANSVYSIKAWTISPNGGTDLNHNNDTAFESSLKNGMSGTYVIGTTTPSDYTTIAAAISDVTNRGLCGPVTFNIEDGNYTEQDSVNAIPGASAINTVTFQSKSGDSTKVNWNYASNSNGNYVIAMKGAGYITFKQITFARTFSGGTYTNSRIIDFGYGECHNLTFVNNRFMGIYNSPSALLRCGGDQDSNIMITHNLFKRGGEAMYLVGVNGNKEHHNITINNNTIDSANSGTYGALYVQYSTNTRITNNTLTNIGVGTANGSFGIYIYACDGALNVSDNKIQVNTGSTGIYDYYCTGTANAQGMIFNNFISAAVGTGNNGYTYGIYIIYSSYQNTYFNNIQMYQTSTEGYGLYAYYSTNLNIENNNLVNTGGGYAMYLSTPTTNYLAVDYNNLYAPGGNLANWNGGAYSTLSAFIAATNDSNTISVNPFYKSNTNLKDSNSVLFAKGTPIPGITTDINGKKRFKLPTIGAVELSVALNDAGITAINNPTGSICGGNTKVSFTLKNFGIDSLKSVIIDWRVNGVLQPADTISTNLPYDSSAIVSFMYDFSSGGLYSIKAWTSMPNSVVDSSNKNDTSVSPLTVYGLPLAANAGNQKICMGGNVNIGAASVGTDTYSWTSKPGGYTSTSANPNVSPTATTTYFLTEKNGYNCPASDSLVVTVYPNPVANAGTAQSVCAFNPVSIGSAAVSGLSYSWTSKPAGAAIDTIADPTVSPSATTTYYLTVKNLGGCTDTASVVITAKAGPAANAGSSQSICLGDSAKIGAASIGGSLYSWVSKPSGYTSTSSGATVSPTITTTYYLTEANITCSKTDSAIITVNALPTVTFSAGVPNAGIVKFSVSDTTQGTYTWNFGDGSAKSTLYNPSHQYSANGTYEVKLTVENASQCSIIDSESVLISTTGIAAISANVFEMQISPNPFTGNVAINYSLSRSTQVVAGIYDITGKEIQLISSGMAEAGAHILNFDGSSLPAGMYFVKIIADSKTATQKIIKMN